MQTFRILSLGMAIATSVFCGTITETEANGTSSNNTFGTAQAISGSAFTTPSPTGVFDPIWLTATVNGFGGDGDIDFYSFSGSGPVQLAITDIPYTFPTIVSLFDSTGALLGFSASSAPLKPGSVSTNDSYFGTFSLPSAGTYFVAVTNADASIPNYPDTSTCTGFGALSRPDGGDGGITTSGCSAASSPFFLNGPQPLAPQAYTLQISTAPITAAPEPASLSIAGLGLALVIARKQIVRSFDRRSAA